MPDTAPSAPLQPQLYDPKGQPLDLPTDAAHQAIVSGQATFLKGQKVHVITPQGVVGTVPSEQAGKALSQGNRLASDEEIVHAQAQARYGGVVGQAATAGLGALSGLTLGASDEIASAFGGREYIQQHREANPKAWLGGQVVGAVAPALVGDEAGLAGLGKIGVEGAEEANALARAAEVGKTALSAASAPSRAVSTIGEGIEHAVRGAMGADGEGSAVANLAKNAIAKGAGGAAEMALYGGAEQLDEDVLGDHEVNGEKLLAAMGHGSLLGFAGGAGLSAAGALGSAVLGRVAPKLDAAAAEQAVRTLGMRKAFASEASRIPGGFDGVGRRLLDTTVDGEPLLKFGDRVEDAAPRIEKAADEAGERVGKVYDTLDASEVAKPKVAELIEDVRGKTLPDLEKMPGTNKSAIHAVETWTDDLAHMAGVPGKDAAKTLGVDRDVLLKNTEVPFRDLQQFRTTLGKAINWKVNLIPGAEDKANEALKKVYGALTETIESRAEKAAGKVGGTLKDELKQANLAYRQLNLANRAAQDSVLRAEANRVVSPSDYLTGAAMAAAHHGGRAVVGGLAGSAVSEHEGGGALPGFLTGAMAALAHHAIRTRGNASAAVMLDKLAAIRGIERAARHVDNQIERGVGGFFREGGRVRVKTREPLEADRGEHVAETVGKRAVGSAAQPALHAAAIDRAASPIATHAPNVANAFQRASLRATMYLAQNAPKPVAKPSITPQFDRPMLSDSQKRDYARVAQAVHDPMTVLADMEAGRVSKSQVDAIRVVYPSLYGEIVQRVHERLADLKHPLDYSQKIQLSTLLGVPADATMTPDFIRSIQSVYAQPNRTPSATGKGRGGGHLPRPVKDDMSRDVALALNDTIKR